MGANVPEDIGLYFSWGNIEGHSENSGYNFSQEVYNETPGSSILTDLPLNADAANVILGGGSRMPTDDEVRELNTNCSSIWTTHNGMPGRLFTSNINGKTLFIPAAGRFDGTARASYGASCFLWTNTYVDATHCKDLYTNATQVVTPHSIDRKLGLSIRPVLDPNL